MFLRAVLAGIFATSIAFAAPMTAECRYDNGDHIYLTFDQDTQDATLVDANTNKTTYLVSNVESAESFRNPGDIIVRITDETVLILVVEASGGAVGLKILRDLGASAMAVSDANGRVLGGTKGQCRRVETY